ncbi:hypothetical protein ARMGADRAFT_814238 [Armillaria gallica]|uniref:Uncharacterized protein n=1 Tax=Armillaria gallica TaxID=47427 RepID=A0A2H3CRV7_ARMGA|nr:hypothetical protein ARMGADRAFT_814238 [Armillaria gallica]
MSCIRTNPRFTQTHNFGSSSSCTSSLCLLCFTKPFLPCPIFVSCSHSHVCMPTMFQCICSSIKAVCNTGLILLYLYHVPSKSPNSVRCVGLENQ